MVANVRPEQKRIIVLEDSSILEAERRAATSFDTGNGSILTEIGPVASFPCCLNLFQYDTSSISDAFKNNDNSMKETEFLSTIDTIARDNRFRCYRLFYRNVLPLCVLLSVLSLIPLVHSIMHGARFAFGLVSMWFILSVIMCLLAQFWRRRMQMQVCECFRSVNRSLTPHNLIAGLWDYGIWPNRKVLLILMRYRIRDCVPTVERAFFARWAEQGNGRVDIESGERKDRSIQLLLSESNQYVAALAKGLLPLSPACKEDGRPNHSQLNMCLCRFVINRNFVACKSKPSIPNRIRRVLTGR